MSEPPEPTPWGKSVAKEILTVDIMEGRVTEYMNRADVYNSRAIYRIYRKDRFCTNLGNLLKALKLKEETAILDGERVRHDQMIHPRPAVTFQGVPYWDTSTACKSLRKDVKDGLNKTMKTEELWNFRAEYKLFPFINFRQHVVQEVKKQAGSSFCMHQKKKEEKK